MIAAAEESARLDAERLKAKIIAEAQAVAQAEADLIEAER